MDIKIRHEGFFLIPNFENYAIDPMSLTVTSLKNKTEILPVKAKRVKKYKLSKNGIAHYLTLFEILQSVIDKYF